MNIRFPCPACDRPASADAPMAGPVRWQCPDCDHLLRFPAVRSADELSACAVCGNTELYKKKNFPHWLGLSILTLASVSFLTLPPSR